MECLSCHEREAGARRHRLVGCSTRQPGSVFSTHILLASTQGVRLLAGSRCTAAASVSRIRLNSPPPMTLPRVVQAAQGKPAALLRRMPSTLRKGHLLWSPLAAPMLHSARRRVDVLPQHCECCTCSKPHMVVVVGWLGLRVRAGR